MNNHTTFFYDTNGISLNPSCDFLTWSTVRKLNLPSCSPCDRCMQEHLYNFLSWQHVSGPFVRGAILCLLKTDLASCTSAESNPQVSLPRGDCPQHGWTSYPGRRWRVYGCVVCIWKPGSAENAARCTSTNNMGSDRFQKEHQGELYRLAWVVSSTAWRALLIKFFLYLIYDFSLFALQVRAVFFFRSVPTPTLPFYSSRGI